MSTEDRIAKLEAELASLKAKAEPEPEEPFKAKVYPKYDPTERLKMPASAAEAMAWPEAKRGYDPGAWAQTKRAEPGGFLGPEKKVLEEALKPDEKKEEGPKYLKPDRGWISPMRLENLSGVKWCDQLMDVADAQDKAELEQRLRRL